eukprot:TRINITY_DN1593_c0_g3_i1.p2 TRINITY_DN1593_c0_g3~~TRINITY_DN1593_c0_g3_i1.p2  ORF type:complete len:268 (-),score=-14.16 TRINITY_DN1593_c0_g3_i1:1410-2213(-)
MLKIYPKKYKNQRLFYFDTVQKQYSFQGSQKKRLNPWIPKFSQIYIWIWIIQFKGYKSNFFILVTHKLIFLNISQTFTKRQFSHISQIKLNICIQRSNLKINIQIYNQTFQFLQSNKRAVKFSLKQLYKQHNIIQQTLFKKSLKLTNKFQLQVKSFKSFKSVKFQAEVKLFVNSTFKLSKKQQCLKLAKKFSNISLQKIIVLSQNLLINTNANILLCFFKKEMPTIRNSYQQNLLRRQPFSNHVVKTVKSRLLSELTKQSTNKLQKK